MAKLSNIRARLQSARTAADAAMGEIEAIRVRIGELRQERESVAVLPMSLDEARALLAGYLDQSEQAFGDRYLQHFLSGLTRGKPGTLTPDPLVLGPDHIAAAIVGLLRPAIEASLTQALEHYCERNPGLSAAERADRLAQIDGEIARLEREEESLIRAGETAGLIINRRPDASPAAVLSDLSEGG